MNHIEKFSNLVVNDRLRISCRLRFENFSNPRIAHCVIHDLGWQGRESWLSYPIDHVLYFQKSTLFWDLLSDLRWSSLTVML